MNINISETVKELLSKTKTALLGMVTTEKPLVLDAVNSYIGNAEDRFSALLSNVAEGGDVKFLLERLKEEKDILESEVLSFVVIGKGVAQDIINSIQDIILGAVAAVLPGKE